MVTTIKDNIAALIKKEDAGASPGGESDGGLSGAVGRGDGAVDDGAVCRGHLHRAHGPGGEMTMRGEGLAGAGSAAGHGRQRPRDALCGAISMSISTCRGHWPSCAGGGVRPWGPAGVGLIVLAWEQSRRRPRRAVAAPPRRRPRPARRRRST